MTDPRGNTVTHAYDDAGRVRAFQLPGGLESKVHYDDRGEVVAVETPSGLRSELNYDDFGRIVEAKSSGGVKMAYGYNQDGTLSSARTGTDTPAMFEVDALGLTTATDPNGGRSTYTYDGRNNLTEWIDQNGNATGFTYDLADQLTAYTDPLGRTTSFEYDDLGRVKQELAPSGRTVNATYDAGGRLTAAEFVDGTSRSYEYDELNQVTSITDQPSGAVVRYRYDPAGNIVEVVEPGGESIGYRWDLVGNRTQVRYPSGETIDYTYDAFNRLSTSAHSTHGTTSYSYDIDGRLTSVEFPDGRKRTYGYRGELLVEFADGDKNWQLAYDAAGRITKIDGSDQRTFTYDEGGQLLAAAQGEADYRYGYDAVGNLVAKTDADSETTYAHDAASQLTGSSDDAGRGDYSYDEDGRLVEQSDANGDVTDYVYDAEGRLDTVTTSDNSGGSATWDRTYTPDGLLRSVTETTADGEESTWELVWDRTFSVPRLLSWAGEGEAEFLYGEGLNQVVVDGMLEATQLNPLGDVIDSEVGVAETYDPFGNTKDAVGFGLGYRGELHVGPTINLKARDYDPELGRFLTVDPFAPAPGLAATSGYAYAANDPINFADPLGLSPTDNTFKDFIKKQFNEFSVTDAFRGVADAGLDRLKDIGDLAKMGLDLLSCGANKATFGLFGSCDKTKALIEGTKELFGSVAEAIKNRNLKAVLDILQVFLPDRCQFSTFELDYCLGYATATAVISVVTGSGATRLFAKLKNLKEAKPNTLDEAADAAKAIPGSPKPRPRGVGCSFAGDTNVLMADGTQKPIAEVRPGDRVASADPVTGSLLAGTVTALVAHEDVTVELDTTAGKVTTTEDHLFWNATDVEYQRADVLDRGDLLASAGGGHVAVEGLVVVSGTLTTAFNLTVNAVHSYFVQIGHESVLVHNECPLGLRKTKRGNRRSTGPIPGRDLVRKLNPLDRNELAEILEVSIKGRRAEISTTDWLPDYSHLNRLAQEESLLEFIKSLPDP